MRPLLFAFVCLCMQATAFAQMGAHLCPEAEATHVAVKSGSFQDPATWSCGVPGAGAKVFIPVGVSVKNHETTADLLWLHVAGELSVCDHCTTKINVNTVYIPMGGEMHLGEQGMPVVGNATLEWVPTPFLSNDWQKLSRGLICHGEFTSAGIEKLSWGEVSGNVEIGSKTLKMSQVPYGWQAGDKILIAGTDTLHRTTGEDFWQKYQTEFRTITAVNGKTVTFDQPVVYRHFRWLPDLPFHCANLSRNVTIRSRSTTDRGHIMFMSSNNNVRWTRIEENGRTDKSKTLTDPRHDAFGEFVVGSDANPRARYAIHWHKIGQLSAAPDCVGCVVDGSPGWGFLIHDSRVNISECVAVRCFGFGFGTEEGQERGSFRRCLSAMHRGLGDTVVSTDEDHGDPITADFGKDGAGFWLQGGMTDVVDCVAFDCSGRGFAFFNRAMNSYPVYPNYNGGIPPHLQFPIIVDKSLLSEEYQALPASATAYKNGFPSSAVPQRVFRNNTAYNCKKCFQGWSANTNDASSQRVWPESVRGLIQNFTMWGFGNQCHMEYQRNLNIVGMRIVGDGVFRHPDAVRWNSTNAETPVNVRNSNISIWNLKIEGHFQKGAAYPAPRPIYTDNNLGGVIPDWRIQGTYPIVDRNGLPTTLPDPGPVPDSGVLPPIAAAGTAPIAAPVASGTVAKEIEAEAAPAEETPPKDDLQSSPEAPADPAPKSDY